MHIPPHPQNTMGVLLVRGACFSHFQTLLVSPPAAPLRATSLILGGGKRAWLDLCPAGSPRAFCTTFSSSSGKGRMDGRQKPSQVTTGEEDGWSTGWALRDLSAGILWARNNCLGLTAQLPEAQISDPRGLDTPSMGTWPGILPLPHPSPHPLGSGSFLQNCGEPIWKGPPFGFCSP